MKKTIGILGGMGPAATADLFKLIVQKTEADTDQDHIHILIDCNPAIPDRTASIVEGGASPLPELVQSARRLREAGADFIVIPCNTSHYYIDTIRERAGVSIIDMIEETANTIRDMDCERAIVLCTEGTRSARVYTDKFKSKRINVIYPEERLQLLTNNIIYDGIKKGRIHYDIAEFNELLRQLEDETDAMTVLGCTELSIAKERYGMCGHFVDPTEILAAAAISEAGYRVKS